METRIQKWGNSLALRIPKLLAESAGLHENSPVQMTVRDHQIVVELLVVEGLTLEDLLLQVTDENRHDEVSTGRSVGLEAW